MSDAHRARVGGASASASVLDILGGAKGVGAGVDGKGLEERVESVQKEDGKRTRRLSFSGALRRIAGWGREKVR